MSVWHPERHQHPVQELAAVALGVRDQPDGELVGQRPEQVADQRGLAGADLAGDDRDRRMGQHAVFEHRIGAGMRLRPVEEVRVRQQRERALGQTEILGVNRQSVRHTHTTVRPKDPAAVRRLSADLPAMPVIRPGPGRPPPDCLYHLRGVTASSARDHALIWLNGWVNANMGEYPAVRRPAQPWNRQPDDGRSRPESRPGRTPPARVALGFARLHAVPGASPRSSAESPRPGRSAVLPAVPASTPSSVSKDYPRAWPISAASPTSSRSRSASACAGSPSPARAGPARSAATRCGSSSRMAAAPRCSTAGASSAACAARTTAARSATAATGPG